MGTRRPRAIGEFSWLDSDLGVECQVCGRVAVYCDWEAQACFRERGWSPAIGEAINRFRCRCGSHDLRFRCVPIGMRPKPIPERPHALRPIYAEDARSLRRRGTSELPERGTVEAALAVLRNALATPHSADLDLAPVEQALATLRPHCYRKEDLDELPGQLAARGKSAFAGGAAQHAFNGILRQLGRARE